MAAGHAPDTIGFDHRFVIPDAHAATIWASGYVQRLVLKIFISGAPQTKNRFIIEQPRLASLIHDREDNVMMGRIILNCLMGSQPILDKLPSFGIIDTGIFHDSFVGPMR